MKSLMQRLLLLCLFILLASCADQGTQLDREFDQLRASLTEERGTSSTLITSGKELADRYHLRGETEKALAVLDTLTRATTEDELRRYTLEAWYASIDSANGTERFWEIRVDSEESIPVLEPTDRAAHLVGQYLNLTTGDWFDLAELEGKTVVLDFWTTWCSPCLAEIPTLNAFRTQYESKDVRLISICSDADDHSTEKLRAFVAKHGIEFIALADKPDASLTRQFQVGSFPTKRLINRQGTLMRRPFARESSWVSLEQVSQYLGTESRP